MKMALFIEYPIKIGNVNSLALWPIDNDGAIINIITNENELNELVDPLFDKINSIYQQIQQMQQQHDRKKDLSRKF